MADDGPGLDKARETIIDLAAKTAAQAGPTAAPDAEAAVALDDLPMEVMKVVVANVDDFTTLMRLRIVTRWLGELATQHMRESGVRCGPRQGDFDTNGVLFMLGCAFGRKPWSHMEVSQRVRVFTSTGLQSAPPLGPGDSHPFFRRRSTLEQAVEFNNPVGYLLDRAPRRVFLSG